MFAVSQSGPARDLAKASFASLNRLAYSFPPDHGAKAVAMVLEDAALSKDWKTELEAMRVGMLELRQGLADALRRATNSDRFDFVADHRGMFSLMGLSEDEVVRLREEHAIYMVAGSRVNIAGIRTELLDPVATAIADVI